MLLCVVLAHQARKNQLRHGPIGCNHQLECMYKQNKIPSYSICSTTNASAKPSPTTPILQSKSSSDTRGWGNEFLNGWGGGWKTFTESVFQSIIFATTLHPSPGRVKVGETWCDFVARLPPFSERGQQPEEKL